METIIYGAFLVCWLYHRAGIVARTYDTALGIIIASVATWLLLRIGSQGIDALRGFSPLLK